MATEKNEINLYEFAARNKIRFRSVKGDLTVEQLWELPLESKDGFDLDGVAKATNKELKALTEESFVRTGKSAAAIRLERALELVVHVIETKLAEARAAKNRAEAQKEREMLIAALAEKQKGELSEMSRSALEKRIKALEAETRTE